MTGKRFGMYQNILYDDGDILNPFDAMKLLNYFDKENTKLKKENEQLKQQMQTILKLTKKIEDCTYDIKLIGDVE